MKKLLPIHTWFFVFGLIFLFQTIENKAVAQKGKSKAKANPGKTAAKPEGTKTEKPGLILPVTELKLVDKPGYFQGIPDSLLYSSSKNFMHLPLTGDRFQYPVILVPVKLQSGFLPDVPTVGKELMVLGSGISEADDVVYFKEQGLPEALLIRTPILTRQLNKVRSLQNDSIRFFCFTSGPQLGNEIFLKKNRNCNTQELQKKIDLRIEYLNSIIKPELPKQPATNPDAEAQAKP
jgi:hypothetical protein